VVWLLWIKRNTLRPMKKNATLIDLLAFTIFLVGCQNSPQPLVDNTSSQATIQQAQHLGSSVHSPRFGWKQFHEETFETHPVVDISTVGDYLRSSKWFSIPHRASRLRVAVQARSAIFGGVLPQSTLIIQKLTGKPFDGAEFKNMPCSLQSVNRSEIACDIDRNRRVAFYVRDARSEKVLTDGFFATWGRNSKLSKEAALSNVIQISLSTWQCIENCEKY
jgi:hypothetical protein